MQLYNQLSNKWIDKHVGKAKNIAEKHGEAITWLKETLPEKQHLLASGVLGGLMLLTAHVTSPSAHADARAFTKQSVHVDEIDNKPFIITDLARILPHDVRELTPDEEASVAAVLSRDFDMQVSAMYLGKRLNRSYGYIGQEQHLARFPGDTMSSHFDTKEDSALYEKFGMAPGLGAWRYFADSKESMTQEQSDMEKYYIAVQTFLAPHWAENTKEYNDFFKFRKMLVVNPQNGKGIVTVIGDVGPAEWTGKHLGGSPEVMRYLERFDGAQRGPVLYYFINDLENKVKLGPVE